MAKIDSIIGQQMAKFQLENDDLSITALVRVVTETGRPLIVARALAAALSAIPDHLDEVRALMDFISERDADAAFHTLFQINLIGLATHSDPRPFDIKSFAPPYFNRLVPRLSQEALPLCSARLIELVYDSNADKPEEAPIHTAIDAILKRIDQHYPGERTRLEAGLAHLLELDLPQRRTSAMDRHFPRAPAGRRVPSLILEALPTFGGLDDPAIDRDAFFDAASAPVADPLLRRIMASLIVYCTYEAEDHKLLCQLVDAAATDPDEAMRLLHSLELARFDIPQILDDFDPETAVYSLMPPLIARLPMASLNEFTARAMNGIVVSEEHSEPVEYPQRIAAARALLARVDAQDPAEIQRLRAHLMTEGLDEVILSVLFDGATPPPATPRPDPTVTRRLQRKALHILDDLLWDATDEGKPETEVRIAQATSAVAELIAYDRLGLPMLRMSIRTSHPEQSALWTSILDAAAQSIESSEPTRPQTNAPSVPPKRLDG